MYIYIYMYICIYMYLYLYIYIYIYINIYNLSSKVQAQKRRSVGVLRCLSIEVSKHRSLQS